MNKISTLTDFVTDHIASNFSVRPDTIDAMANRVRLAVIELQKDNLFPETSIVFDSLDMKEEKRDGAGRLIYNYYDLPKDFRQLYNNGPAFEVNDESGYRFVEYGRFIHNLSANNSSEAKIISIHTFNGEFGKRNRLIVTPFPSDDDQVTITYYSNGVDMPIEDIEPEYYMPVINHVLHQLGLVDQMPYKDDVNKTKRNRQSSAGQGSHHQSFATTPPRFFGNKSINRRRR